MKNDVFHNEYKGCDILAAYNSAKCRQSARIERLKAELFRNMPQIEAHRAVLLTESYMQTEGEPIVTRRAKAFKNILDNIVYLGLEDTFKKELNL